jgi:hypothetical protein
MKQEANYVVGLDLFLDQREPENGLVKELPPGAKISPCPVCGELAADKGSFLVFLKETVSILKGNKLIVLWGRCGQCSFEGPYQPQN